MIWPPNQGVLLSVSFVAAASGSALQVAGRYAGA